MMLFIVIIYMLAMLLIGFWCNKHYIKGMTDFLLAGRRLGVVLCSFALAATHFGGGCIMTGGGNRIHHRAFRILVCRFLRHRIIAFGCADRI